MSNVIQSNQTLADNLFKTKAIRVCPQDKPFWYTSGKIGPYYINTHFLYGSEEKANVFLSEIDRLKDDKLNCSMQFHKLARENYASEPVYKDTVDTVADYITSYINVDEVDYISGGERRDWFFSFIIADLFEKPHITIFKDLSSVIYKDQKSVYTENLEGAKILHVADLITTASSYERAWIPAVRKLNGNMKWSMAAVDRLQGGEEVLKNMKVESHAAVYIDESVFKKAHLRGYISSSQLKVVLDYMKEPEKTMKVFLMNHPEFLHEALAMEGKTAERAKLLISNNFYDVNSFFKK
jgi:orotate phosphoribosyltransferase